MKPSNGTVAIEWAKENLRRHGYVIIGAHSRRSEDGTDFSSG
jgi:hypothetical protein